MLQTKVVEKITTHVLGSTTFSPKIMSFRRQCGAGQATDGNMAHALSMLNT
jgi:hypothetical protein